jgi:hypothetical protein
MTSALRQLGLITGNHLFVAACASFSLCSNRAMTDHPASWRMPTPKQMDKLVSGRQRAIRSDNPGPEAALPQEYWKAVLRDPRAGGKPWLPLQQMRLSEIPRELLRVECARCSRCVEIQRMDAVKRMPSGRMLVNAYSTTAARSGRDGTKRTVAGRTGHETGHVRQQSVDRVPDRATGHAGSRADGAGRD